MFQTGRRRSFGSSASSLGSSRRASSSTPTALPPLAVALSKQHSASSRKPQWQHASQKDSIPKMHYSTTGCSCPSCRLLEKKSQRMVTRQKSLERLPKLPFKVGDRVVIVGNRCGVIRWVGRIDSKYANPHVHVGVQLDDPEGFHDGILNGKRYFKCPHSHGIFVAQDSILLAKGRMDIKYKVITPPDQVKETSESPILAKQEIHVLRSVRPPSEKTVDALQRTRHSLHTLKSNKRGGNIAKRKGGKKRMGANQSASSLNGTRDNSDVIVRLRSKNQRPQEQTQRNRTSRYQHEEKPFFSESKGDFDFGIIEATPDGKTVFNEETEDLVSRVDNFHIHHIQQTVLKQASEAQRLLDNLASKKREDMPPSIDHEALADRERRLMSEQQRRRQQEQERVELEQRTRERRAEQERRRAEKEREEKDRRAAEAAERRRLEAQRAAEAEERRKALAAQQQQQQPQQQQDVQPEREDSRAQRDQPPEAEAEVDTKAEADADADLNEPDPNGDVADFVEQLFTSGQSSEIEALDAYEFATIIYSESLSLNLQPGEEAKLMELFDTSRDGRISYQEFVEGITPLVFAIYSEEAENASQWVEIHSNEIGVLSFHKETNSVHVDLAREQDPQEGDDYYSLIYQMPQNELDRVVLTTFLAITEGQEATLVSDQFVDFLTAPEYGYGLSDEEVAYYVEQSEVTENGFIAYPHFLMVMRVLLAQIAFQSVPATEEVVYVNSPTFGPTFYDRQTGQPLDAVGEDQTYAEVDVSVFGTQEHS